MSTDVDTGARRRKSKALLAGGVVLGLGAAVTLAAWTDDVWVSGSFSAGTFNVQGAVDGAGTAWQDYDSQEGAGPLAFTVNPTAMTPGDSVYAPLNLRVGPNPADFDADITLSAAPTGPAAANIANNAFFAALELSLYDVPPVDCNVAGTDATTALSGFDGVALSTTSPSTVITLGREGSARGVCFKVTLSEAATTEVSGGETGPLTWNFHAESVEP